MNLQQLALAIPILPLVAAALVGLVRPIGRRGGLSAGISIAAAAGSLGCALALLSHTAEHFVIKLPWLPAGGRTLAEVGLRFDGISAPMLVVVGTVALMVQIYSVGYLAGEGSAQRGRYFAWQSLFLFSMQGFVLSPNLLQLFGFYELIGLCSYLLIGYYWEKPSAGRAATKAFWITKLGDVGFLIGLLVAWTQYKSFDLDTIEQALSRSPYDANAWLLPALLFCGVASKSAQFPLHVWLPDAMEGPTPVSALLHAATMVAAGVYLLVRLDWLFALTPQVLALVAWIGAITALLAAILACVQTDIKRVLAYSTVSQLGYMMTAIGAGFAAAGFLHLLTHGVFKALLFLGAGAVIHAVGSNDVSAMGGLARKMPQTAIVFLVGTLSLAGVPLFAGFASKEEVLAAVWTGGFLVPFAMLLLAAFLTAFYMFRVVFLAFFGARVPAAERTVAVLDSHDRGGASAHHHAPKHAHDAPAVMTLPLWVLALIAMGIGIYFTLHAPEAEFHAPGWLTPAAVGVALGGILLAWLTYERRIVSPDALARAFAPIRYAALRKFWLDDIYVAIYRSVLLAFSRAIGWVDRYIVDGVLNVVSAWTLDGGDRLRRMQTGKVQDYVFAVGFGLLALVVWIGVGW